jgi:hypothetical protein
MPDYSARVMKLRLCMLITEKAMKNRLLLLTALFIITGYITPATAQTPPETEVKNELVFYAGGGAANLVYSLAGNGTRSGGFGVTFGAGYLYNFSESLGVTAGLEIAPYSAKAEYIATGEIYETLDDIGSDVRFTYSSRAYSEKQSLVLLSIPIMAQYKVPVSSGKMHWYAAGGFKIGFPAGNSAKINQTITTAGYYTYENQEYHDLANHGYYNNFDVRDSESKPALSVAMLLSLETGLRFSLYNKLALYAGAWLDYGMNNLKSESGKHLVQYNRTMTYESVLNTAYTNKINLISMGVKVKIGIVK